MWADLHTSKPCTQQAGASSLYYTLSNELPTYIHVTKRGYVGTLSLLALDICAHANRLRLLPLSSKETFPSTSIQTGSESKTGGQEVAIYSRCNPKSLNEKLRPLDTPKSTFNKCIVRLLKIFWILRVFMHVPPHPYTIPASCIHWKAYLPLPSTHWLSNSLSNFFYSKSVREQQKALLYNWLEYLHKRTLDITQPTALERMKPVQLQFSPDRCFLSCCWRLGEEMSHPLSLFIWTGCWSDFDLLL